MVAPTHRPPRKEKASSFPRLGSRKLMTIPTHVCPHSTHKHKHKNTIIIPWDVQPGLVSSLFSSPSGTSTSLSPYLGLLCMAVPPTGVSPGPSLSPVPSVPRPLSSPRPEALLLLWRCISRLSPRGSQRLWSTAKVLSKDPEPPLSVTGLESLERTQRGLKGENTISPALLSSGLRPL